MKIPHLLSSVVGIDACRVEVVHNYPQEAAPWENFSCFYLSSADFVSKLTFKKFLQEYHWRIRLNPDQAPHFVGPDLGPNCLQKKSADNTSR